MKIRTLLELSYRDSVEAEKQLDRLFRDIGLDVEFSQHFLNRVLDPDSEHGRNDYDNNSRARDNDVSKEEIVQALSQLKDRYGEVLLKAKNNPKQFVALLKDISTSLNIPFAIDYDRVKKGLHELRLITLMRKRNFHSNKPGEKVLKVKS